MKTFEERIKAYKLIPVVSLPDLDSGLRLAEILSNCGLPAAEITFRTACAAEALSQIHTQFPDLLLLAGTILTQGQVHEAAQAGAQALVSPGCDPAMIRACQKLDLPVIPGISTPSEVQAALGLGLTRLKFFPAQLSGGVKMVQTLLGVYRNITLMPTGGIHLDNMMSYLALDRVFCCGGTWLAPESLMAAGDWQAIEDRVKAAVSILSHPPAD